mmetsp:Transcript_38541/g.109940  ORF Transcript_38541/g.109940 Transcript_38541/m.109940 type:complete len:180 (-) Transcript_38541:165-704(-)
MIAQHVASMIWGYGMLQVKDDAGVDLLLHKLSARALSVLRTFTPQGLANMCWGLALLARSDAALMASVSREVARRTPTMPDRPADFDLPQIACSFARLGMRPQSRDMLRAIASRTQSLLRRMRPWGLCALAWSYQELDGAGEFTAFRRTVQAEISRRRITPEEVARSQLGPEEWRRRRQ